MNIYAKWIYMQNEYICKMNIYAKWIYMQNKYIYKMNIYAKWIYMQKTSLLFSVKKCNKNISNILTFYFKVKLIWHLVFQDRTPGSMYIVFALE